MPKAYELRSLLEEILEDEKTADARSARLSQAEIGRVVQEQQDRKTRRKRGSQSRLGETLIQLGLITSKQLDEALALQPAKGGKVGSLLVELGYISSEQLLTALEKQHGIEGADLLREQASEKAMKLLPLTTMLKHRVIPLKAEGRILTLAMEDPDDLTAVHDVEFITGRRVEPVVVASYQMDFAIRSLEQNKGLAFFLPEMQQGAAGSFTINTILDFFVNSKASDLLISTDVPPSVKLLNELTRAEGPAVTSEQCVVFAKALMTEKQWEEFLQKKELDFAIDYAAHGRFRVNAYRQRNTISLALRRIRETIPGMDSLGLPDFLKQMALKPQGLILFAAPTGHGKTTSLHAMIDLINENRGCNIITLEDPIEYLHKAKKSNINQREIGTDTDSFAEGLKRVLRQAPDVIVIGELRDSETIETAVRAASSGHLVISTVHALNATAALDSMVNYVPPHIQPRVRLQLAEALQLIFSQRLIMRKRTGALVVAYEKLINSYRIKNLIRENKEHQIRAQIQHDADDFSSIDTCLVRLIREGKLTRDEAAPYADNLELVNRVSGQTPS